MSRDREGVSWRRMYLQYNVSTDAIYRSSGLTWFRGHQTTTSPQHLRERGTDRHCPPPQPSFEHGLLVLPQITPQAIEGSLGGRGRDLATDGDRPTVIV